MKQIIEKVYPFVFFAMILVLPFEQYIIAVPNIILLVLVILFPIAVNKTDFQKLNKPSYILYTVFAVYLILNSIVFGKLDENLSTILKVFFPLVIILFYLPIKNFKYVNYGIIYSSFAAIIFSVFNIGFLIYQTGAFEFGTGMNPVESLPTDRIYLGLLCLISILVSYKVLFEKSSRSIFHILNISINILFLFLIVSRMAIITLVILIVLRFFYGRFSKRTFFISIGTVTVVAALAFGLNSNIQKRFLLTTSNPNRSFKERLFLMEPRTKIWDCAFKISDGGVELLSGLGFQTTVDKLVECYDWNITDNDDRKAWYISQRYNSHNQFLDFYLSTGIISALLFLGIFIVLFLKKRKDYFSTALLLTIFLFAIVESFFHRQIGGYYLGVILIFLLIQISQTELQNKKIGNGEE